MSISYEGVAEQVVTMKLDTTGTAAKEGDLVSLAANNTVGCALLALDSSGKLDAGTTGRPGIVTDVDTAAGICGVIFC